MSLILSKNPDAIKVYELAKNLQKRFVHKLDNLSLEFGENKKFEEVIWLRENGRFGGGNRFEVRDESLFNSASVNVSQIHYESDPSKSLESATAISTIIHPKNPNVPSIHIHISLTILKDGNTYYRLMADLNPSIANTNDKEIFDFELKKVTKENYKEGSIQGDKYFFIPALNRHRGISHFYLENYKTSNKENDLEFAKEFGQTVIDTYINIITNAFETRKTFTFEDTQEQLAYHTLYLFQVLTLDRGTTSGLLVHNQNDVGIMGSLPKIVNKKLLQKWIDNLETPQNELLINIIDSIEDNGVINTQIKEKLAQVVRNHYKKHPHSLKYQASGNTSPSTVDNHTK